MTSPVRGTPEPAVPPSGSAHGNWQASSAGSLRLPLPLGREYSPAAFDGQGRETNRRRSALLSWVSRPPLAASSAP